MSELPADTLETNAGPIVLHVPHSSTLIPESIRPDILLSDSALEAEVRNMTDSYTDELFAYDGALTTRFPISRLIVDPERFLDDDEEPMAACGMGVIYTSTSELKPLRTPPSDAERTELIGRFYEPHHRDLEANVAAALVSNCECVVIDCHSFPDVPRPYEQSQEPDRPDLCIGTDPFHTPDDLVSYVKAKAKALGMTVAINMPFAGALVPAAYYQKRKSVVAIMLEVNRRLYIDERTGKKSEGFAETKDKIEQLIASIEQWQGEGFMERLTVDGDLIAKQFWDGGKPGYSGYVSAYNYYGSYVVLHDAGMSVYPTRAEAVAQATMRTDATVEVWTY